MQNISRHLCAVIVACGLLAVATLTVHANDEPLATTPAPSSAGITPVLITELQTGGAAAGDEFVELHNQSTEAVDVTGWQIRYRNAASQTASTLVATIGSHVMAPGSYLLLHSPTVPVPADVPEQAYTAKLAATDKAVGLFAPDTTTCQATVQDAVAWGISTAGEGSAVPVTGDTGDGVLYRYSDVTGTYSDTNSNAYDFGRIAAATALPTPGAANQQLLPASSIVGQGGVSALPPVAVQGCSLPDAKPKPPLDSPTVPATDTPPPSVVEAPEAAASNAPSMPARNNGLFAPQISEILPNPAKPQTDANDEFVELYNPNTEPFELSGFVLEVGAASKKRYTFPAGTLLPGKQFQAFYAKDTNLTLSNTQGQVWLLDPLQRTIGQSDAYAAAKDGQAWLFAASKWQWTTMPTPGKLNIVKAPAAKKAAATASDKSSTTGSVRAAATTQGGSATGGGAQATDQPAAADGEGFNPLHPGVLAITGVVAVLYALYEYRRDLANKFYQFRRNRAARREARRSLPGRGGD